MFVWPATLPLARAASRVLAAPINATLLLSQLCYVRQATHLQGCWPGNPANAAVRLMQPSQHHSEGCCTDCRAGEVTAKELEDIMQIVSNPRTFKIPDWFLNRQKDHKDGRFSQLTSSALDTKLREDLERLKKIRWAGSHHF